MRKIAFTALFVFSIVLNLAVAATLGLHYWRTSQTAFSDEPTEFSGAKHDLKAVHKLWPKDAHLQMKEMRRKIRAKRAEVLDILAANPNKPETAEKAVKELISLRTEIEYKAIADISAIMAKLQPEKRKAFAELLKKRGPRGHAPRCRPDCERKKNGCPCEYPNSSGSKESNRPSSKEKPVPQP